MGTRVQCKTGLHGNLNSKSLTTVQVTVTGARWEYYNDEVQSLTTLQVQFLHTEPSEVEAHKG